MIAAVSFALAALALAWLAAGVWEATAFFAFLAVLYAAIWAFRLPRPRRVRADFRYCRAWRPTEWLSA